MKYVVLCIAMVMCFAFAGSPTTAAPLVTARPAAALVDAPADPAADAIDDEGDSANTCGGKVCGKGTYCCNPSCGICVPKGMSCTQQSCN